MSSNPRSHEITSLITALGLVPLEPEGGFFAQTFLSPHSVETPRGPRPTTTAIYYLLTTETQSRVHLLHNTEIWHFYAGDAVVHETWDPASTAGIDRCVLGSDIVAGQRPQRIVAAGVWQTARLASNAKRGFALLGTTMSPGFVFEDFELAPSKAVFPDAVAAAWEKHL